MGKSREDVESGPARETLRHWEMLWNQGILTPSIIKHNYSGSGTEDDPYVVGWIENDPRNPLLFPSWYKWSSCLAMATAILAVSLCSSAFTGGLPSLIEHFHTSEEVATLGLSLFVLGFAIGPLFWAPLSEQASVSSHKVQHLLTP